MIDRGDLAHQRMLTSGTVGGETREVHPWAVERFGAWLSQAHPEADSLGC